MLGEIPTVGEGSFKQGQWIQFCTNDPVDEKLETIYLQNQFYFITSVQHLRSFKKERHIYVADTVGENIHKFCTNKMEFDHTSLNKNTQIKFASKADVEHALGKHVDIESFEERCLAQERRTVYFVHNSESSVSSDSDEAVEGDEMTESSCQAEQSNVGGSSQMVSTEPDGMDLFCPDSENQDDDSVECLIS